MKVLLKIFSISLMLVVIASCKGADNASNYPTGNLDFVAPAGAGAGARRGQPGAGRRAAAHAADGYSAPGTAWRTAAKPLGAASGRAAAGGSESGPVSENQRYWPGAALAAG